MTGTDVVIVPPEGRGRISTLDANSATAGLAAPFDAQDIEWRIARSGVKNGKPWGMCLAYLTNRAIMDRLDGVLGPENWKNEFTRWGEKGVMCGLSLRLNGEWVTKWDGAEETDIESVKGGFSSAMKRAAVQWGIGRYLYGLEEGWAKFEEHGPYSAKIENTFYKWSPPGLPAWAVPTTARPDRVTTDTANPVKGARSATQQSGKDAKHPSPGGPVAIADIVQPLSEIPHQLQQPEALTPTGGPVWLFGSKKGVALSLMRDEELTVGRAWLVKKNKTGEVTGAIAAVDAELKRRIP